MVVGGGGSCGEMKSFVQTLVVSRWMTVFGSILIMAMAGTAYMFGLYSNDIKVAFGFDQTTLNLLGFFKDFGANIGIPSGLINEVTPPWIVLSIGAIMNFFGYFMIWLAVNGHIATPDVWQMCLYICIGANSQTFANTGVLVTGVVNFQESRGSVLGLLKGFVGLSGAIMTQFYHAFYGDNSKSLILLIAWLPAVVIFIFLGTIRITKSDGQAKDIRVFYKLLYISIGLASLLMVLIIIQSKFSFTRVEYICSASLVVLLMLLPSAVVVKEELDKWKTDKAALQVSTENLPQVELTIPQTHTLQSSAEALAPKEKQCSCVADIFEPKARGEDYTILQGLFSVDMLILFTASTCGFGGSLTAIDNLGQIGKSLGYPTRSLATFVSLVSIWNYLGRVIAGFGSEFLLAKYKVPRPLVLTFAILSSCAGHLLIAFGVPNSLYFASVIMGFCYGAQWPLMYAMVSEIFGLKYYSTLYNFVSIANPIGSYILNVRVAGHLYDKEALKQMESLGLRREAGQVLRCSGVQCYKMAFLAITATTFFGCLVSLFLVTRTRKFYQGGIYKKFREEAEGIVD